MFGDGVRSLEGCLDGGDDFGDSVMVQDGRFGWVGFKDGDLGYDFVFLVFEGGEFFYQVTGFAASFGDDVG